MAVVVRERIELVILREYDKQENLMRKTIYPVFVLILLAFVFVGCKSEIGETRTVSLVSINAGGALEIDGISSRDTLELTDFSLNDGIYLEVVNPSRTLVSRGDGDSEYLYKMQSGSFIPVPDSTGTSVFSASNLGIDKKANVIVHKMPTLDNDFIISSTEDAYVGKRGLVEEYYYVDLNDPRWSDLDRSEIVVSLDREGGGAFQVIQHGIISRSNNGVLDFSDPSIDGFGVYVYSVFDGLSQTEYCKVQIKNPLHPDSSPVTLVDSIPVLLVDKQEHGEYKLEIAFSGDDAQAVSKEVMNLGFFDTSHTDGSIMPKCVIKELDYDNCKMILHLGSVEEPFVLTLGMRSALSGFSGASATIRLLKDEPGIVFHDISNLEDPIIVQSSSNGCAIWAFKSEIEQEIEIVSLLGDHNYTFCTFSAGVFNQTPLPPDKSRPRPNGQFLITAGGVGYISVFAEGLSEGTILAMIKRASQQFVPRPLDCDAIQWDPDSLDYVCVSDDCPACSVTGQKRHYSLDTMLLNAPAIFDGCYVTEESFDGFGRICFQNGNSINLIDLGFALDHSNLGRMGASSFGVYGWNLSDTSKTVEIILKYFSASEKKIVCDIVLGDSVRYNDVVMSVEHNHVWKFSDEYAVCESCGESRSCISLTVGPGGPYKIKTNGTVIVIVSGDNHETVIDGYLETPKLDKTVMAYLFASNPEYRIKECETENNVYSITLEKIQTQ